MIPELKKKRRAEWTAANDILRAADSAKRGLTASEDREYNEHIENISALDSRIDAIEENQRSAQNAESFMTQILSGGSSISTAERALPTISEYRDQERALGNGSVGVTLGQSNFAKWTDRLRSASVFLKAAPRLVEVPMNSLSIPVVSASVTVGARDENTVISPSDPTIAGVTLQPVSYAALSLVSNEAIRDSDGGVVDLVTTDLIRSTATKVDGTFFAGTYAASPYRTAGLTTLAGIGNIAKTGDHDLASISDALSTLQGAGANTDRLAYFINPVDYAKIRKQLDTTNRPLLTPDMSATGNQSIFGVPIFISANVPVKKSIMLDLDQVIVGIGAAVTMDLSEHYAFNSNATALRITTRVDVQALNKAGLCTVTSTT
ncbi:phage major capsid protein [Cryobacterium glucosi]|uniref:Phage major capsid protein n=1 Tax=Cryobacterium glucosi TaxID=1259175 RepID=A0ABY2INQ2_9MICO|nr:phage major capsid protein [Cryobacterium glucosi]TFC21333.1 phage major capsid protein [Cryobacterium glucosi]